MDGNRLRASVPPMRIDAIDHLYILWALMLRDLRLKYRNSKLGVWLEFLRPIVVTAAHYYFFLFINRPMPAHIPIESFVIAGFSVWFAFYGASQGMINGAGNSLRVNLLPGITRLHLQLARAGRAWMVSLVFCLFAWIPLVLLGDAIPFPAVGLTLAVFLITGGIGVGFGLIVEQLGRNFPVVKILDKLVTWALFISSGLYFSIATSFRPMAQVVWFNPLLHLVEYERYAFDPGYPVALVNLAFPIAFAIALPMVGLAMARARGRFAWT